MDRRTFLKTAVVAGGALLLNPARKLDSYYQKSSGFFGVHPFIEKNPGAVFIMRTAVDKKTNSDLKKHSGVLFGSSVFIGLSERDGGVPLTNKVVIKPNLTSYNLKDPNYHKENCMGIITDVDFVEGIINSLKYLGLSGKQIYIRETNSDEELYVESGYRQMASRTGVDVRDMTAGVNGLGYKDIKWMDVKDGGWFVRIPYLWPVNAPDVFLINIAKLKAHGMGLTLCAKNLQGTIASPYQKHCKSYDSNMSIPPCDVVTDARAKIKKNYDRHLAEGIPRWDKPGYSYLGGLGQETWVTRCLDNNSVIKPHLNIIEGIYGRDGDFIRGPHNGLAQDFIMNYIIFGKNPFYVDIIGHWLAAHEPGNFGLFHLAKERGFISLIDPSKIPVYEWKADGTAIPKPLKEFQRIPLLTYYLTRDYKGQSESYWHLCNEPYNYITEDSKPTICRPKSFVLMQNYPHAFSPSKAIEFAIPHSGFTRLEIYNSRGRIVDVLVDRHCRRGSHLVVWKAYGQPSGAYFYRLYFAGFSEIKKLTLV
jgi:uncharacterized protein (DUF362 family)